MKPVRRISSDEDMELFKTSSAFNQIIGFVLELDTAVQGYEVGLSDSPSPAIGKLLAVLRRVSELVDKHPAGEQSSRFGKPEFKEFYDDVSHSAPAILETLDLEDAEEPGTYFVESWGNRERIDYGSGHELNFLAFLLSLRELGLVTPEDDRDLVLGVFAEYLRTMRKIQKEYLLEPAGSHGVWGLDDYHFLPFLFGAGQLVPHKFLRPISIHDRDVVDMYADKYLYYGCIQFINEVKTTGSLRWHSPMLDDISGVKKWAKVNEGMIKMYKAEVLGKLPIMQHFMFGALIPAAASMTPADQVKDRHTHNGWGDCCGIKIPSAIGASQGSHRKPIPFD